MVFDPVKALRAANLLVVLHHRLLLDKYMFTELEKQHTIFYAHILIVVWNGNMDSLPLQNKFSTHKIATYFF